MRWILAITCVLALAGAGGIANADERRWPTLEEMLSLHELGGLRDGFTLSPDGSRAALFRRQAQPSSDDYRYDLIVVDLEPPYAWRIVGDGGGWIHAPGRPSGAALDRVLLWSPDGRSIAYLALRNGQVELWRSPLRGAPHRLLSGEADIVRFAFTAAGDAIIYETGSPREALAHEEAERERIGFYVDDDFAAAFSLRPPDRRMEGERVWRLDLRSRRSAATTPEDAALLDARAGSPASAHAAPATPGDDAAEPVLAVWLTDESGSRRCAHAECAGAIGQVWSGASGNVYFLRMEGWSQSVTALYRWNVAEDRVERLRAVEDRLFDCEVSRAQLFCLEDAALQPRRLVSIALADGAMRTVYDPNPAWAQFELARFERIDVEDAYGNEAFAHLFYPSDYEPGRRYPLVVVQYRSRGFLRGGTGGEYPIHELARRGYFVLSVDRPETRALARRMSARELQETSELDHSERIMKLSAIEALLDVVEDRGLIDPRRVAITGLSDGAETLYWAITHSDRFAAAVASTPPIDAVTWVMGAERFRRGRREEFGFVGPWSDAQGPWATWWRETPPIHRAGEIRTPLLMQLADVEALPAFPLFARLREDDRAVELYLYPGEYHLKWRPSHILAAQERALAWLDFWLQDVERPDPREGDRIARWRALRTAHEALAR